MSSQRDLQWAHNEFTSVMITAQYTLHLLVGFWKYVHFMLSKLIFKQAEIIALDNWKKKKKQPKDKKASGNFSDILISCKGKRFAKKRHLFSCWRNAPLIAHMSGSLLLRAECMQTILERHTCLEIWKFPFLKTKFDHEEIKPS